MGKSLRFILGKTIFSLCFFVYVNTLSAQGCCSGGNPLSGNLDLAVNVPKTLSIRLTQDYNNLNDLIVGSKELSDKTRIRTTNSTLLNLNYTLNNRLSFTTILSYVQQKEKIEFGNIENNSQAQGFGDLIFLAQYNLLSKEKNSISAAVGVKLPTGAVNRTNDDTNLLLPPDLQPGTGAIDYLFSTQYSRKKLWDKNLRYQAGLTFRLTNPADRFNQLQVYEFGNELQVQTGLSYDIFLKQNILSPLFLIQYRYADFDKTDNRKTPNTGGHWFSTTVGLMSSLGDSFSIRFQARIPVYRQLDGVQLTTSYRFNTSLNYIFTAKEKFEIPNIF